MVTDTVPAVTDRVPGPAPVRPGWSYVVPLATARPVAEEFTAYLTSLAGRGEVVVVDGSPPEVFARHHLELRARCLHVRPDVSTLMGKVGGVVTGVRLATHERVVVADDDVRYGPELEDLVARLDVADVVRPQNYFDPLPWHAAWDSGRSLLNRVWGGDWPGTLAVRRSSVLAAGGYAGDVLFENYELVRTVRAVGGRELVASDLYVRRLPPTTRHFLDQRVRQAYDELARPLRLVPFAAVVPVGSWLAARRRWRLLGWGTAVATAAVAGAAECGRRRDGARARYPLRCSLVAPLWALERSLCVWAALGARARGGVRYRDRRIRQAALTGAERRRRIAGTRPRRPRIGGGEG